MIGLALAVASVASLAAVELERLPARDAGQGVGVDRGHVYAVDNHSIARIRLADRREVARWSGDPALFPHINSCTVDGSTLLCAASNYPATPMASRIERFDKRTLRHLGTWDLGHRAGSLTWIFRHKGAWWACYANYDGKGGEPGRDHRATVLVRYDHAWLETGRWRLPDDVLARMAPRSASGGAWGRGDLLYVTGHDRPELYVLRVPRQGSVLEHVATIATPTGGQAIAIDPRHADRLWSVERKTHELVASRLTPIQDTSP